MHFGPEVGSVVKQRNPTLRLQKEGVWGNLILTLVAGMRTNLRSGGDRSPGLDRALLSASVTITSLSISAISTNCQVKAGSIFFKDMVPQWRSPEGSFSGMFSIFFSSATGILPGTTISGDLKDPATTIPKGTLLTIMWTTLSYLGISVTIADLNTIAPIISNFLLCSYAFVNFSCFHVSLRWLPGWHPSFRWYSPWLSLLGSLLCLLILFLLTWWAALIAMLRTLLLLLYTFYKKLDMDGGPEVQAAFYRMVLSYSEPQAIQESKNHVKWLNVRKVHSFYMVISVPRLCSGAQSLMQVAGLGHLKPNLLVFGYKENWQEVPIPAVEDYVSILHILTLAALNLVLLQAGWWTVDVYWLSSDGGLMLLIPFLLTCKKNWARCPIRVFVSSPPEQLEEKHTE
ncbi:Solute Carrier Family 12 Member 3 [Manis pentadactyla]|nr:Solute Carrier Family 12 Member 3 [Manis pentadactyla]